MQLPLTVPVFIISDATGRTAEAVMRAALVQFPGVEALLHRHPQVSTRAQISSVLERARYDGGMVIYSLVDEQLRDFIRAEGREQGVILFDVLGPIIGKLRQHLQLIPLSRPGLLRHAEERSLRLGRAIEYTLKHDDGLGLETAAHADVLLLGISRTSKTPTSVYLACNHVMNVVNVPIIPGRELPEEVTRLSVPKVGLTIGAERLASLRRSRLQGVPEYAELPSIRREIEFGLRVLRRLPHVPTVDVTHLSIEEIADEVLRAMPRRGTG